VIGLIGTAIDLSDLKKHEDAMRLAMREITHRTKNLLAVIQATARRTAAKAPTKEAFVNGFAARLSAMSQSHDLLVRSNWRGADMATLVERNANQAGTVREGSFSIEGPPLTLTSDAAQHFGMALHELVSNALKYGALAVDGGSV
jgi:two-component sensor histidine kinase